MECSAVTQITDERLETLKEDLQTFRNCFFDEAIAQRLGQELVRCFFLIINISHVLQETSKDEDLFRDALVVVAGLSSDLILPEVPLEPPPEVYESLCCSQACITLITASQKVPEPMGDRDARKALKAIVAEKLHRHTENADKVGTVTTARSKLGNCDKRAWKI